MTPDKARGQTDRDVHRNKTDGCENEEQTRQSAGARQRCLERPLLAPFRTTPPSTSHRSKTY